MTVAKKKPGKNATKLQHPRAIWCELKNLAPEQVQSLADTAMGSSQIQSRFWDLWSDHHRGENNEIILRQWLEARKSGRDVGPHEIDACPSELWGYLQKQAGEEFDQVHGRVIALLSNRFIKALKTKVPVMGGMQTWACVLLGAIDRPFHVGLGIVPFDAQNARLTLEEDQTAVLAVRIVRGAEPLQLRLRLPKVKPDTPDRWSHLRAIAAGKRAMNGGWLFRAKFGRWCVAFPEEGRRPAKRSRRYATRTATIKAATDAALVIECGKHLWRLTSQLGQVAHVRRVMTAQMLDRRYGAGSGRAGHGRQRRRLAEASFADGKWQRLADRVNDQLAHDAAAVTGKLGAGKVVYLGGAEESALVASGVDEQTPHSLRGWQWHDLGTKIGAKLAIEGAEFVRADGYFAGEEGGKCKPRKKKRVDRVAAVGK